MKYMDTGAPASTYIDMRNLAWSRVAQGACPVAGCAAQLDTVGSERRSFPYCPSHRIRIHAKTFVYYHGEDRASKCDATLRNILFEPDYFIDRILGNQAKAETHRMGHETSEDALTWNVFSRLARTKQLSKLVHALTGLAPKQEPELYLWGLKVALDDPAPPSVFPALVESRDAFEKGIKKFHTEPDIMLYSPGQVLLLIEAKFTSGNTLALESGPEVSSKEQTKSREGLLRRYASPASGISPHSISGAFYSQLYRNLAFAQHMAAKLGVQWGLVSLVSEGQCRRRQEEVEYQDPTKFIHSLVPSDSRNRFVFYSWEQLYTDHVAGNPELNDLAAYMVNKSANGAKAFAIEKPYQIAEHKHRYAAWAASRAASTKTCRFNVLQGKSIIEHLQLATLSTPESIPAADEFDGQHRKWRESAITHAEAMKIVGFSHGVAAKLINVYLKGVFVCGGHESHKNVVSLHPPIDSLLLNALYKNDVGGLKKAWGKARKARWSKFDSDEYESVIEAIRENQDGRPLWEIEQYWRGYQ